MAAYLLETNYGGRADSDKRKRVRAIQTALKRCIAAGGSDACEGPWEHFFDQVGLHKAEKDQAAMVAELKEKGLIGTGSDGPPADLVVPPGMTRPPADWEPGMESPPGMDPPTDWGKAWPSPGGLPAEFDLPPGIEMPKAMEMPEGFKMPEGWTFEDGIPPGMSMPEGFKIPEGWKPTDGPPPGMEPGTIASSKGTPRPMPMGARF